MRAPKPGDIVRLKFWDHVANADECTACLLFGRVHKVTDEAVTVDSWAHLDPAATRTHDEIETFAIYRPAIYEIDVVTDWKSL